MIEALIRRPHVVAVMAFLTVIGGLLAFRSLPLNLFPEVNRPMVSVVTQWPGASADDVAVEVTHPVEVRLSAIDGVRRVTSTSRDEVSAVSVEFSYATDIDSAVTDVLNELSRVRGQLPTGTRDSVVFKITEAARPVVVLSVTPRDENQMDLSQVRRIAENPLRDRLLQIESVVEVEVFGGHTRQLAVDLDRNQLESHGLTPALVATALANANVSIPAGRVHDRGARYLLTAETLVRTPAEVAAILVPLGQGRFVRVGDLGAVRWSEAETSALYRGNGKAAIAVSLLRGTKGFAEQVLREVQKELPAIREDFPMLNIEIADTQGRLIHLTVSNMLSSLRDAVIMTLLVLLLFLGNTRAAVVTAVSLPMSYLLTFVVMQFLGLEFNMVTLTAVIIAVGLLADDAVVVIENVERRLREKGEAGVMAAARGTSEILLADTAGTISTVVVLVPIMFIGGYVQQVLRPLTVTLSVALLASLIVSVCIIPVLAARVLRPGAWDPLGRVFEPFERWVMDPIQRFYAASVGWAIDHKAVVLTGFAVLLVVSLRQLPLLGRELMPLMDTGVIQVVFEAEPDTDDDVMNNLIQQVEAAVNAEVKPEWLVSMSTVAGAEPGVKSFGAARTLQQGETTINLIDRFQRDRTIYEIEEAIRQRLRRIPGLISANVYEFGATPLSSIRGTIDVMISGPDPAVLDELAIETMKRLETVSGLSGYRRSWQSRSERIKLRIDPARARLYGLTAGDVARQVRAQVGGIPGGRIRVAGESPITVWVRLRDSQRGNHEALSSLLVKTGDGRLIPLLSVAELYTESASTALTHQALITTVDIMGYRRNVSVTHLQERVDKALADLSLPRGYSISQEGTIREMNDAFQRLGKSLLLGLLFLYLMLVITFRSFLDPLAIMVSLPLSVIGAAWAMLLAAKHGCLPSFMGLILLMGIVVNNGILLVDFAKRALRAGKDMREAVLEAVKLRTRPILMTAGSSAVGMIPIAMEWAVGIERLSPLAVVAIGGLLAGTFLTLIVVPLVYVLMSQARSAISPKKNWGE